MKFNHFDETKSLWNFNPAKAEIGAELGKKEVVTKLSGIDIHIGCSYIVNI